MQNVGPDTNDDAWKETIDNHGNPHARTNYDMVARFQSLHREYRYFLFDCSAIKKQAY